MIWLIPENARNVRQTETGYRWRQYISLTRCQGCWGFPLSCKCERDVTVGLKPAPLSAKVSRPICYIGSRHPKEYAMAACWALASFLGLGAEWTPVGPALFFIGHMRVRGTSPQDSWVKHNSRSNPAVSSPTAATGDPSTQAMGDDPDAGGGTKNVAEQTHKHGMPAWGWTDIEMFKANGTWTRPSNTDKVLIKALGGGGGGAGGHNQAGAGGGGGAYAEEIVTVTGNVTVTRGSGGAAGVCSPGSGSTSGSAGTASTFGSDVSAGGGAGGTVGGGAAAGGTSTDDINVDGQDGSGINGSVGGIGGGTIWGPGSSGFPGSGGDGSDSGGDSGCSGADPAFAGATGFVIVYWNE